MAVDPNGPAQPGQPVPMTVMQGTQIPLPVGGGVEGLQLVNPPFRTNAPAWYTLGIWGKLGCAVPQPGRYLQSNNEVILDLVKVAGQQLFYAMWNFPDRKFQRYPSRDILYALHQFLIFGRKRLADLTVVPNQSPMLPTHAKPAPQMFIVNPVPFYGPLGCINAWLMKFANMIMLMCSEAMQHTDNEIAYYVTKDFHDVCYGYLKYLLVDMAMKFFGVAQADASKDDYFIPADAWTSYDPAKFSITVEGTSSRPPMGLSPTDLDLEPIRDLPVEIVIPYLQPWPDSQLKYASGGIWSASQAPAGLALDSEGNAQGSAEAMAKASAGNPLYQKQGPPTA